MRHTLEQSKAMTPGELFEHWRNGRFPFDRACCDHCLTTHRLTPEEDRFGNQCCCLLPSHAGIRADSLRLGRYGDLRQLFNSPAKVEELYALRLFYDHLYPQPVESAEEKAAEENAKEVLARQIEIERMRLAHYEMSTGELE